VLMGLCLRKTTNIIDDFIFKKWNAKTLATA
jgi:hypothetical protein